MPDLQYYRHPEPFLLEQGGVLNQLTLAYTTAGNLNQQQDNVIWVVHALTANSDPSDWWPGVVGPGLAIDTLRYFVVCVNCIGSPYGSTCPLSPDPTNGKPYYHNFPFVTNRDIARAFDVVRTHLGIERVTMIVGASIGGQQLLEWLILAPEVFRKAMMIATNAKHSPWGIAFNETQRMAIETDATWTQKSEDAGKDGLMVARSVAMLSYRTAQGYNLSQKDDHAALEHYRAASYQRYQGQKLAQRFNAFSYRSLTLAMDSHNIGRNRKGIGEALHLIKASCMIVGIDSDLLFPLEEQQFLASQIPGANLEIMHSLWGHDGFLTETHQVSALIRKFFGPEN
ncbi:MAG: homoserine O-acetyltransferase [Saprospiraceae bacterium]|jgi:homoserine O-acetyltransferase|nr:homoserine O-acetyltransferase [Saprospiraceae bacterium]